MRRRRRTGLGTRASVEEPLDPVGCFRARLEHRAHERSHHVPQEAVGGDGELEASISDLPAGGEDVPDEHLVLRLGRRERAEVVLSGEKRGGSLE